MSKKSKKLGIGILSFGAYVPRLRMSRKGIVDGIGWAIPGHKSLAKGERSMANWDEDVITMAFEAGHDCLRGIASNINSVQLASTTLPFVDRSNSGIVADALQCGKDINTQDLSGSRRAATTALNRLSQVDCSNSTTLLLASECRDAQPGSAAEMLYGHGAAAILVGQGEPIAVFKGVAAVHSDLVDQYRGSDSDYDYTLEDRWVREEGYLKLIPEAIEKALLDAGTSIGEVHRIVLPAKSSVARALAKQLEIDVSLFADPLSNHCGDCGSAHPLLMLAASLEAAVPGEQILVLGFGQGADAIVLETTSQLAEIQRTRGLSHSLKARRPVENYTFFLAIRDQLSVDYGKRAERDNRTALSTLYRKRDDIAAMMGGRCQNCETLQFPQTLVCVSCGSLDSQAPESLSGLIGTVKSYTEDWMAYTPSPPYIYGNVEFGGGANVMLEFTDFGPGEVEVGSKVRMVFRVKDFDEKRKFRRYFWKPAPVLAIGDE